MTAPGRGRVLAIDLGDARMGLALSDELWITAQGLSVIPRASREKEAQALRRIAAERGVSRIVVGLPRRLDGKLGPQAEKVLAFVRRLTDDLGLPVELVDERFTTKAASAAMIQGGARRAKRKEKVDQVAATLVLQTYLERARSAEEQTGVPRP